jgi:hypothetical protein
MEQPAQAQEARKFEVEQVTAAHPHRVQGGHELCRNDSRITGAQMLDQGKGAAMAEQYVAGQVNQVLTIVLSHHRAWLVGLTKALCQDGVAAVGGSLSLVTHRDLHPCPARDCHTLL